MGATPSPLRSRNRARNSDLREPKRRFLASGRLPRATLRAAFIHSSTASSTNPLFRIVIRTGGGKAPAWTMRHSVVLDTPIISSTSRRIEDQGRKWLSRLVRWRDFEATLRAAPITPESVVDDRHGILGRVAPVASLNRWRESKSMAPPLPVLTCVMTLTAMLAPCAGVLRTGVHLALDDYHQEGTSTVHDDLHDAAAVLHGHGHEHGTPAHRHDATEALQSSQGPVPSLTIHPFVTAFGSSSLAADSAVLDRFDPSHPLRVPLILRI